MLMRFRNGRLDDGSSRKKHFSFSIINSEKYGKKIHISSDLLEELGNPACVKLSIQARSIHVIPSESGFTVKANGMIYHSEFVKKLTDAFKLDFSNKPSMNFKSIRIKNQDCCNYAVVIIISLFSTHAKEGRFE